MVTGTATGGVGLAGSAQGFEGLFASLLGSGFVQGEVPAEVAALVAQDGKVASAPDGAAVAASPLPVENVLQLGGAPAVQVQGEQSVVAAFMVKVQEIFDAFARDGVMPRGQELANALIQLGIPADQAQVMAARIDTVMKLLDAQQDIDKDTENSIEAMMLAALLGGRQGGFEIRIVQVDAAAAAPDLRVSVDVRRFVQGVASSADLARQMSDLSVSGQPVMSAAGENRRQLPAAGPLAAAGAGVGVAGEVVPGQEVSEEGFTENSGGGVALQVHKNGAGPVRVEVSPSDNGGVVSVSLPGEVLPREVAEVSAALSVGGREVPKSEPVRTTALAAPAVAAPQAEVRSASFSKVEKVADKVEGATLYRWAADEHGHERVQVVQPADEGVASNVLAQQQVAAQGTGLARDVPAESARFGDRLQMASQARVAEQVAIQIKPVADMGGGTVRMTLNPPELGQVQIELTMHNGKVHGAISAGDQAVVEHLARELHSLRQGLADAGLKLGEQGISLMLSNQGHQQNPQQGHHAQPQGSHGHGASPHDDGAEVAAAHGAVAEVAAHWVSPDRVVDVRI